MFREEADALPRGRPIAGRKPSNVDGVGYSRHRNDALMLLQHRLNPSRNVSSTRDHMVGWEPEGPQDLFLCRLDLEMHYRPCPSGPQGREQETVHHWVVYMHDWPLEGGEARQHSPASHQLFEAVPLQTLKVVHVRMNPLLRECRGRRANTWHPGFARAVAATRRSCQVHGNDTGAPKKV